MRSATSLAYAVELGHNVSMQFPKSVESMVSFLSTFLIVYLLMCLALYLLQRQLLFFPTSEVEISGAEQMVVDTGEERIRVWRVNPGKEEALVYFGGNAENVAYNIATFAALFEKRTLYLVNYRGYSGSSGSPSEAGLYHDALGVYDHIAADHRSISVMGRSIGSAVATYLASKRPVQKLLLVTPFDSAVNVGRKLYWFFPMELIMKEQYDSLSRVGDISAPTLIMAAAEDEIIPYENTLNLARAFPEKQLQFESIPESGHNTLHLHPRYEALLMAFMEQ